MCGCDRKRNEDEARAAVLWSWQEEKFACRSDAMMICQQGLAAIAVKFLRSLASSLDKTHTHNFGRLINGHNGRPPCGCHICVPEQRTGTFRLFASLSHVA